LHHIEVDNFQVSQNTYLAQDIDCADVVIYWGSTSALEALSKGKPIIHFKNEYILSFDPLFDCDDLKWVVTQNDSLVSVLNEIYTLDDNQFFQRQRKAQDYLNSYFYPISEENLQKFERNEIRTH